MNRFRLSLIVLASAVVLAVPAAQGASSDLVISQIYASGGNAGATFANDYVELFNRGSSTVDLTGWTVQYAPATSTSWSPTTLAGSIAPGRHYLVAVASAGTVGSVLPTPDATGTTNFAASGGKIAVDRDTTALTSTTAAVRDGNGCTDTDSNTADITAASPTPHNSSAAASTCGTAGSSSSQTASVDVDIQSVISLTLERSALSFGNVLAGQTPAPLGERVTVVSNASTGYSLSVHRAAFTPADLPLGISATAPTGTQLAPPLAGGAVLAVPIAPATDLLLGTSSAATASAGDVWPTSFSFTPSLPSVPAGQYATSVTFTVIGR